MGALISAPLSMAATCGGSLLGSCCASMACKACSCACTLTQRVSSFVYLGLVYIFLIAAYTFKYQGGPIVIGGSTNATESSILDKMRHAAMDQTVGQISDRWNSNFWCAPRYPTGIIICCEDVCGGDFAVYRFSFTLCLFFAGWGYAIASIPARCAGPRPRSPTEAAEALPAPTADRPALLAGTCLR